MKLSSTIRLYHDISESKKMLEKDLLTYGYGELLKRTDDQEDSPLQIEEDYGRLIGRFNPIRLTLEDASKNNLYYEKNADRIYINDVSFRNNRYEGTIEKISYFIENSTLSTKLNFICLVEDDEVQCKLKRGLFEKRSL